MHIRSERRHCALPSTWHRQFGRHENRFCSYKKTIYKTNEKNLDNKLIFFIIQIISKYLKKKIVCGLKIGFVYISYISYMKKAY